MPLLARGFLPLILFQWLYWICWRRGLTRWHCRLGILKIILKNRQISTEISAKPNWNFEFLLYNVNRSRSSPTQRIKIHAIRLKVERKITWWIRFIAFRRKNWPVKPHIALIKNLKRTDSTGFFCRKRI